MAESAVAAGSSEVDAIEKALSEIFVVSTKIARLLDVRRITGDWTTFQREEIDRLLVEEDRLRNDLKVAHGPDWRSSRRWID